MPAAAASPRARKKSAPPTAEFIAPMKALAVSVAPEGVWHCEIKFDGYRAVALLHDGHAELWSRNHKPMSRDYPEIIAALEKLKCRDAVLDGEIVAVDATGRSRFQLLQGRDLNGARPLILYYVFDIMQRNGERLLRRPIEERRKLLESLLKKPPHPLKLSPEFSLEPSQLLAEARRQQLEGIIAKRPGSLYEPDRRSGAWIKCKILHEQEFVIGGFTPPQNSREFFGALLVGYYRDGKLLYAGKVGTGFDRARLRSLHAEFLRRRLDHCPFANLPSDRKPRFGRGMTRSEMQRVTWLKPQLVAQIKFGEWTSDGLLRQPVFLGLRQDKPASAVRREASLAGRSPRPRSRGRPRQGTNRTTRGR